MLCHVILTVSFCVYILKRGNSFLLTNLKQTLIEGSSPSIPQETGGWGALPESCVGCTILCLSGSLVQSGSGPGGATRTTRQCL